MITITDKSKCTGCSACYSVCPKHCITMDSDKEGFRYPSIDADSCINCKLCENVCPVIHTEKEDTHRQQYGFLVQHKDDEVRKQSTSGGAFSAIASWVIENGGVVFGAGYKKGTFVVTHQPVERIEDLYIFRNSKYVQSELGDCFSQIKEILAKNRIVLFSGTPCQIEGLCGYLRGKEYNNLILVDLVCHGIPSPRLFSSYLNIQRQNLGGEFTNVLFRDKYYGYHYSSFSIYNVDSSKNYHKGVDSDPFLRAFFGNLSDRPSCYSCPFKKRYRKSDLTLWDCFSIERFTKELDRKGTTSVLAQTEKGRDVINCVRSKLNLVEVNPDELTKVVREMFHSVPMNPKREAFFCDLDTIDPKTFFKKWFPTTWKVRLNSFFRITCHKLGIYSLAKKFFLLFYTRRDVRQSRNQ